MSEYALDFRELGSSASTLACANSLKILGTLTLGHLLEVPDHVTLPYRTLLRARAATSIVHKAFRRRPRDLDIKYLAYIHEGQRL